MYACILAQETSAAEGGIYTGAEMVEGVEDGPPLYQGFRPMLIM